MCSPARTQTQIDHPSHMYVLDISAANSSLPMAWNLRYKSFLLSSKSRNVQPSKDTDSNRPPLAYNTVQLKVPLCCEGCEETVREELTILEGVDDISVDRETQKVVVKGDVKSSDILNTVKKVKNRAELWRN